MATLYDQSGRPIKVCDRDLEDELSGPTLAGVRSNWSDYPSRKLSPQRLSALLTSADEGDADLYLELAEEMEEKDPHYAAVIATRKRAVAQLPVHVEPASEDERDQQIAETVEQVIFRRDAFQDELIDMLDAIAKGYSVCEIIWSRGAREWSPAQILYRDPRWFRWDYETQSRLQLRTPEGDVDLAPGRFIVHVAKAKSGLPIRGGIARAAVWFWMFGNYALKDWLIFLERFSMPTRVGKYPAGTSERDKQVLLRALRDIGADAAAAIPEGMLIEFIEAKISGSVDAHERFQRWREGQLSKLVLGQTETTDANKGGYATASVHERVKEDICGADAAQLAATLTRDLVRPFVDLNFGRPPKGYPRAHLALPPSGDITALATALPGLVDRGLKVPQRHIRREMSIPEPDEGDELLEPQAAQAPSPAADEASDAAPPANVPDGDEGESEDAPVRRELSHRHAAQPSTDDDDSIDRMLQEALADWEPLMAPVVEPLRDLVDKIDAGEGNDQEKLERLRAALAERIAAMDTTAMQTLLERASFNARLAGETEAPLRDGD